MRVKGRGISQSEPLRREIRIWTPKLDTSYLTETQKEMGFHRLSFLRVFKRQRKFGVVEDDPCKAMERLEGEVQSVGEVEKLELMQTNVKEKSDRSC